MATWRSNSFLRYLFEADDAVIGVVIAAFLHWRTWLRSVLVSVAERDGGLALLRTLGAGNGGDVVEVYKGAEELLGRWC